MNCPKCGSDNVMPTYIKGKYKCQECGHTFTVKEQKAISEQKWFENVRKANGAKDY